MANAVRLKLHPLPPPVPGEARRVNGVRLSLRKLGEGTSNARPGQRVPARLEFHAAHLKTADESPGIATLFASLDGELELRGASRQPAFINGMGDDGTPKRIEYTEPYTPEVRDRNRDVPRRKSIKLEFDPASFQAMLDVKGANSHLILPEEPEGVLYLELDTHLTAAGQPESELGESDRLDVLLKGVLGNPVPPTSIGLKLFSEDGTTPSDIRFELNDVDGNLHQGVVDERGEAFVDGLTPGRCTVVLKDLAPSEWGAEPKAGGTSAAYTSKGEEDLPLIAVKNGYQSWRTLFDAKENAALREARPSPDHLAKDDGIQLPPKESEPVPVETGQVHMFRVETRPVEMLRLRIDSDTSFVYELTVAGSTVEGEGEPGDIIEHQVPPDATDADLLIYDQGADPKSGDKYKLKLGALEPVSTDRGVQARLTNLGFDTQGVDGNIGDKTKDAIEQFQLANGLEATREADEPTRARIEEKHDRAPPATSTAAEQVDSA